MINFILTKNNHQVFYDLINKLDKDKFYQITVKERKVQRSTDQNKRLWMLYTTIGNDIGYSAEEMHELLTYKFLSNEKVINGEKIVHVPSTSKLSVDDMIEYQKQIEFWASTTFGMQFKD